MIKVTKIPIIFIYKHYSGLYFTLTSNIKDTILNSLSQSLKEVKKEIQLKEIHNGNCGLTKLSHFCVEN